MKARKIGVLAAVVALFMPGCKKGEQAPASQPAAKAAPTSKPAKAQPAKPLKPPKPEYRSGAHILVAYKGARRAKPEISRTKEQALKLAQDLAARARKAPGKFAELAAKHSDGPSGPRGGDLGTWPKGRMVPAFDAAIDKLKPGEISEPVETPFGYHVIIRREVAPEVELAAVQLLISHKGAMMAKPKVKRTKEAAAKLAARLAKQAQKRPESFDAMIKKHSDGPRASSGGSLGAWNSLRSRMPPIFTSAVRALKVGEVSDPVESPYGFHLFRRTEPPPVFAGSHILVAYKGARRASPQVSRTKEEAKKVATQLAKELKANPGKFVEYAATKSDGPSAARGGSLGKWPKGQMVPEFDKAIEKLKIGEISDPVETAFGFHVMRREDPAKQD